MEPGIHRMTNEEYHAEPCEVPALSKGTICNLLQSPARAWWEHPKLNPACPPQVHERKFDLGTAVHNYVLEGGNKLAVIWDFTDWKKKAAQEQADLEWSIGNTPLLESQYETVRSIGKSVIRTIRDCTELEIDDLLTEGDSELSYVWNEDETWFRTRPDWISNDKRIILDIKTTGKSADPEEFSRHAVDLGYDIQSALYRRGVKAIDGVTPEFIFIVVEIKEPFLCCPVSLSAEFQELGRQKVEAGIALWKHCMKTGKWPGYPTDRICWAEAKPYQIAAWESKLYDIRRLID